MLAGDAGAARAAIETVRSEFPDATHHVWAFALRGRGAAPEERCHDAGEPAGTAGPSVLQAIRSAGLLDLVVVVTRYFGGTKLGKGGLARAYREAATRALEGAPRAAALAVRRVLVRLPLALDGEARHLIARHGGRVESTSYDEPETSVIRAAVPEAAVPGVRDGIQELARGRARVLEIDQPEG